MKNPATLGLASRESRAEGRAAVARFRSRGGRAVACPYSSLLSGIQEVSWRNTL